MVYLTCAKLYKFDGFKGMGRLSIGSRIRTLRKNKGLSLQAVATDLVVPVFNKETSELVDYKSVTGATISNIELDKYTINPPMDTITALAEYFEVSLDWILNGDGKDENGAVQVAEIASKPDNKPKLEEKKVEKPVSESKPKLVEAVVDKRVEEKKPEQLPFVPMVKSVRIPVSGGEGLFKVDFICGVSSWENYTHKSNPDVYGLLHLTTGNTVRTLMPLRDLVRLVEKYI